MADTSCTTDAPITKHWLDPNFSQQFTASLASLRESRIHTDVTLTAEGLQLPCHRVVLSAASEYFRTMFSQGFEEANSDTVEVKDVDPETLRTIIDYLYAGAIEVTSSNVQSLVQAADMLQLLALKNECEKFLMQLISLSNCVGLYKLSQLVNLQSLQSETKAVMLRHFRKVVKFSEFLQLDEKELTEYIKDDKLNVSSENMVFEAVMLWLKHDETTRQAAISRLLEHVRLSYCTRDYLWHVVKVNKFMSSDLCKKFIEEAFTSHSFPDCKNEMDSPRLRPRSHFWLKPYLVVVGGFTKEQENNPYCYYFKEDTSTWEQLTKLPTPNLKCFAVCVVQGSILVTGGKIQGGTERTRTSDDCWLFNASAKSWKKLKPMAFSRSKHKVGVIDGRVYAVGGIGHSNQLLSSVEIIDFKDNDKMWPPLPDMREAVFLPGMVTFGGSLYVFGGYTHRNAKHATASTQMYSIEWKEWHFKASMPCRSAGSTAVTVSDKIYIVGGVTTSISCMSYEPATDTWAILEPTVAIHSDAAAVVWKGKILLGGGIFCKTGDEGDQAKCITTAIEEYDITRNQWTDGTFHLGEGLHGHHFANVNLYPTNVIKRRLISKYIK